MIVPLIKMPLDFDVGLIPNWIERVKRFGLFGRVSIGVDTGFDHSLLEKIVIATGGLLEVQVLMESFDEELGLSLLNAGANQILVRETPQKKATLIPDERIDVVKYVSELKKAAGDVAEQELNTSLISEQWRAGIDHLVDVGLLEPTGIFADILILLLQSDRDDGLWPTVIVDELGVALGLAYSSSASLRQAIEDRVGVYFSRSRNEIWVKGKTSGAMQKLIGIRIDCDFDTLRFQVEQGTPGFCHNATHTCFGYERNIAEIIQRLHERISGADEKSFTKKLFDDPAMLRKKLLEEAQELSEADSTDEAAWEAADVLYFSLIAMMRNGAKLADVYAELARRTQRVVRRPNKLEK